MIAPQTFYTSHYGAFVSRKMNGGAVRRTRCAITPLKTFGFLRVVVMAQRFRAASLTDCGADFMAHFMAQIGQEMHP